MQFMTHKKELVSGSKLNAAIESVRSDFIDIAYGARVEDFYAPHVTEQKKDEILKRDLERANNIEDRLDNFTIWQRVNTKLTGKCVAILK